jgi:hypothetical protein
MDSYAKHALENDGDREIGALLDRAVSGASIIDQLMAIPLPSGEDSGSSSEWNAAIARRLQHRLVETMRAALAGEPVRRSA